jgi:YesN/AraC family two-component response regulator
MKVFVVDDEVAAQRILRDCCEREPDLEIIGEFDNADDALDAIRRAPPDLVFLDIALGAKTGMDVARALDRDTPEIVFVTAYDRYAIEAFEVGAVDYLLKPFDDARFRETMARVRKRRAVQPVADRRAALEALLDRLAQHALSYRRGAPIRADAAHQPLVPREHQPRPRGQPHAARRSHHRARRRRDRDQQRELSRQGAHAARAVHDPIDTIPQTLASPRRAR